MTPEHRDAFLRQPHIADLATVRPDGSPHVAPVWYLYDGESFRIITDPASVKMRNIRRDPRVALSIATRQQPYEYVLVSGTVEVSYEGLPELLRTMAVHYMGKAAGERYADKTLKETRFCILTVRPSKITSWADE